MAHAILLSTIIVLVLAGSACADSYASSPENEEACFDLEGEFIEIGNALRTDQKKFDRLTQGEIGAISSIGYIHCETSTCFDEGIRILKREKKRLELKVTPVVEQLSTRYKNLGCTFEEGPSRLQAILKITGFTRIDFHISYLEGCKKAGICPR